MMCATVITLSGRFITHPTATRSNNNRRLDDEPLPLPLAALTPQRRAALASVARAGDEREF